MRQDGKRLGWTGLGGMGGTGGTRREQDGRYGRGRGMREWESKDRDRDNDPQDETQKKQRKKKKETGTSGDETRDKGVHATNERTNERMRRAADGYRGG